MDGRSSTRSSGRSRRRRPRALLERCRHSQSGPLPRWPPANLRRYGRARAAVRLPAALGASPAASSAAGLRRHIVQDLAAALQDPGSRRPVWVSAEEADGTLDRDLYRALLRVTGF